MNTLEGGECKLQEYQACNSLLTTWYGKDLVSGVRRRLKHLSLRTAFDLETGSAVQLYSE